MQAITPELLAILTEKEPMLIEAINTLRDQKSLIGESVVEIGDFLTTITGQGNVGAAFVLTCLDASFTLDSRDAA